MELGLKMTKVIFFIIALIQLIVMLTLAKGELQHIAGLIISNIWLVGALVSTKD